MHNLTQSSLLTGNVRMKKQSGVMLLEALIAVLIFSLGILTLVALQTASIRLTGDARYRASAAIAVERLFSEMRISGLDAGGLQTTFASDPGGAGYQAWSQNVVGDSLAGLVDLDHNPPIVTVANDGVVTVRLTWKTTPDSTTVHTHTAMTQIR